jgi:hypothetical protein
MAETAEEPERSAAAAAAQKSNDLGVRTSFSSNLKWIQGKLRHRQLPRGQCTGANESVK